MTTLPEAVNQMIEVIDQLAGLKDELGDWASGSETGGPANNGTYPFTQPDDTVIMIPSPRKLAQQIAAKYDALFAAGTAQQADVRASLVGTTNAINQIRAWLTGTRNGGLFGDGRYQITLANGTTAFVACPDRIQMLAVAAVDPSQLDDAVWSQIEDAQQAATQALDAVAAAQGLRLTFGERLPTAAVQGEALNGASLVTEGGRNVGFFIPAGQNGRNSYTIARIIMTEKQAAFLAGQAIRLRTIAQVSPDFLTANTLNPNAASVLYADGTTGIAGGVDRSEQVGDFLYREVLLTVTPNMRRVGTPLQITGSANPRDIDRSLKLISTTIVIDTLPGAMSGGTDTAFQYRLDERVDPIEAKITELDQAFIGLGDQLDIAQNTSTPANGTTLVGYEMTWPQGVSGQYAVLGARAPFDGASSAGRRIRIKLAFATSNPFTRFPGYLAQVQAAFTGGGYESRDPITVRLDTVPGYYVLTMDYLVRGDEVALTSFIQFRVAGAVATTEKATLAGYSIGFLTSTSPVLSAADDALRAFRNSLGNFVHFGIGLALKDADTPATAENGATLALDSQTGQKLGWNVAAGTTGRNSTFYVNTAIDGQRRAGARLRMSILFNVSDPFTRSGFFLVFQARTVSGLVTRPTAVNRISTPRQGQRLWTIEYIMQGDEIGVRPGMAATTDTPTASAEYFRAADVAIEWITTTSAIKTAMDANLETLVERTLAQAAATAASLDAGGGASVRTLKKSGGDYATPLAAMAGLNGATAGNRFILKASEGVYTDTEWRLPDYVSLVGNDRDRVIFAGELPDTATASQIELTSAMWMEKESRLQGVTVTMKNGRYAIHFESNGAYPDRLLEIIDAHVEHLGNPSPNSNWGSTFACGSGLSSGVTARLRNSSFIGPAGGFSYHTNLNWNDPSFVDAEGCVFIAGNDNGSSFRALPIGSGVADRCRLVGSILVGDVVYGPSPWLPTTLDKQPANHAEIDLWGYGNTPAVFRNIDFGLALSITSATPGVGSSIIIGGNAAPWLFGDGATLKTDVQFSRAGSPGFRARVVGWGDVSGVGVGPSLNVNITTLGRRLGDCRTNNKTLTVAVDGGSAQSVVFNEDFTTQPNSYVIAYIAARVTGVIVGTLATGAMYRGRFTDEEFEPTNTSGAGIARGAMLAFNGASNKVRLMTASDAPHLFAGFAMFDIEAGKAGRVKKAGHVSIDDILRDDAATFAFGDTFSIGTPGRAVKGGSQGLLSAVRANAVQVG